MTVTTSHQSGAPDRPIRPSLVSSGMRCRSAAATYTASADGTHRRVGYGGDIAELRIGCSGWQYRDWRDAFYPPRTPATRWLEHYATVFDTVEVNATFYRLAKRTAVEHWVEQTPPGFVFALKASRYLTHMKRLTDMGQGVERLYEPLQPLVTSKKLGPVLWQLPENFHRNDERLASALAGLPDGRHAFEFRHESWFVPEVYALLKAHNVAFVIAHSAGFEHPRDVVTADFTYLRFHYGERGRRGNYSATELDEWAERLGAFVRRSVDVYAYFNNDWEAFAPRNAAGLRSRVRALVVR